MMKPVSCRLPLFVVAFSLITASSPAAEKPAAKATKTAIARGQARLDKEDYPAALDAFNEALKLDPKSVAAYIGRGTAYRNIEKPAKLKEALADFNEACALDPKNSEAHRGRAAVYGEQKDYRKGVCRVRGSNPMRP